ncbi:hypothetical protein CC117_05245 [Parafrankia colletiae]|uniref:Uncharacterized protein n=1 Tax=Parafrankia colletiae TaxID=573497 RepID=A0A1S1QJC3_9ACTN|nr:hypothetical protein [Parafrankia colletiae]MCK9900066.1 hypothetical protein [Frankia sp. Cpl3]OHV33777.1 hypothetical protein CC117_05245 [Parafrankia colletiae]
MTTAADATPNGTELVAGVSVEGCFERPATAAGEGERDRARRLIDNGRATMAVISAVSDTGLRVDGGTVAEVHLLVDCPGAEPYPVTRRAVVPENERRAGRTGSAGGGVPRQLRRRVPVLVDPAQPDNVLLMWDLRVAS